MRLGLLPPPLAIRHPGPELMDDPQGLGGRELRETLAQLRTINRRLGGHSTTLRALDGLAARVRMPTDRAVTVLDAGGGSGDSAPVILDWARRRGLTAHVTVVDIHPETVAAARGRLAGVAGAEAACDDLFDIPARSYDLVHCALFLHHFDGHAAVRALNAMAHVARLGVVVNDLHRHWLPWMLIRWLTAALSRNRLIRADAPHSVARAFTSTDWHELAAATGLQLSWRRSWAWRWAVSAVGARQPE